MAKRKTPTDDVERLAERIWQFSGGRIIDRESFDYAFDKYLEDEDLNRSQDSKLRNGCFDALRQKRMFIKKGSVFKKAKGKSYSRDIATTAKTIVTTEKEYIKKGASKVDLKGYDDLFIIMGK